MILFDSTKRDLKDFPIDIDLYLVQSFFKLIILFISYSVIIFTNNDYLFSQ